MKKTVQNTAMSSWRILHPLRRQFRGPNLPLQHYLLSASQITSVMGLA